MGPEVETFDGVPALRVLDDAHLLYEIVRRCDVEDRLKSIPLVCKSFARAAEWCFEELSLDGLLLGPLAPTAPAAAEFWRGLAAWAGRRNNAIRALGLHNLRHLLRELDEQQRRRALTGLWHALASGPAPPRLQAVELGCPSVTLAPGTLAGLAVLPSLRRVALHTAGPMAFGELNALAAGVPGLEALAVTLTRQRGMHCTFTGPFPASLTSLRRLRALHIEAPYSVLTAPLCTLPEAIGAWGPQLRELYLMNLGLEALPRAIGQLSRLEQLCLGRNRLGLRWDAVPAELSKLSSLRRLELQKNGFTVGPPAVVGELTSLQELNLSGNEWGSAAPDLPQEYSQLSQLRFLTLTNCGLGALPPVVTGLSSLKLLKLNINKLQTLPGGPYLQSLECLDLAHNRFDAGYPPALAAATKLHSLAFQHGQIHYSDPAVALASAMAPAPATPPRAVVAAMATAQPGAHLLPAAALNLAA